MLSNFVVSGPQERSEAVNRATTLTPAPWLLRMKMFGMVCSFRWKDNIRRQKHPAIY